MLRHMKACDGGCRRCQVGTPDTANSNIVTLELQRCHQELVVGLRRANPTYI